MKTSVINRPTVAQAMELLGKRVVCKVFWDDGLNDPSEARCDPPPARIVGVVVPAPGSGVAAQILMHDGDDKEAPYGWHYELFLDAIQIVRVLEDA